MDFENIKERYGWLLWVILIVIVGWGYLKYTNNKSLIKEQENEVFEKNEKIEILEKEEDDLANKTQYDDFIKKYDVLEDVPKDIKYSFQIGEYLNGKNIVRKLKIDDIIKRDEIYYVYARKSKKINRGDTFIYRFKLSEKQVQELINSGKAFHAIIKVEKVNLFLDVLYTGSAIDGDVEFEEFIDLDVTNKYKVIEGELIDYLIEN